MSESYDSIRFADNLSNPLYRSADTFRGNLVRAATPPIQSIAMEDAVSRHRFQDWSVGKLHVRAVRRWQWERRL